MKHVPFSIIIPAYGTADYIEECLDSIESQTYFKDNDNFEVLLGIDGCPATLQKAKKIRHKYRNLKVFFGNNRGSYVTVNSLLSEVAHENIIKFDSDDIMMPLLVRSVVDKMDRCDMVKFVSLNFKSSREHTIGRKEAGGVFFFRKPILEHVGGFKAWVCYADTDFIHRLKHIPGIKIETLVEPVFWRRMRRDSLTKSRETGMASELRKRYIKQISNTLEYVTPVTHDDWKQVVSDMVVKSNVCIVSAYTPVGDWKKLGELTTPTFKTYADRHGLSCKVFTEGFDKSRYPAWSKLNFIRETLKEYEWVWWIDSDAAIANYKKTIDKFLELGVDMVVGKEIVKGIPFNTGSWIIRSCDFSFWVLDEVRKDIGRKGRRGWEQDGLAQLYREGKLGDRIKIVPLRELNGFLDWKGEKFGKRLREETQWHAGDFVAHCAGYDVKDRIRFLKEAIRMSIW